MMKRLLILAAIAALFTIVTVVPASAIAVDKGGPNGDAVSVIVPQSGPQGGPNDAHGPACGIAESGTPTGCANHTSPDSAQANAGNPENATHPGLNTGFNVGAWNAVFQAMENSDGNTAICGIWALVEEAETGFEGLACEPYVPAP
jgi:hypothetical protein